MIKLIKFEETDFETFKSWCHNEDELLQFAGNIFSFPVTNEQLTNYLNDPRRIAYKVLNIHNSETIGHCELNFEKPMPTLSRILIGNTELRGKGIGKLIVNAMLKILFDQMPFEAVQLNVFDWNIHAIKCYESIGFKPNQGGDKTYNHHGLTWRTTNMTIDKKDWMVNT
jgi:RimJ/RimL family protein N-acetyltransferase